MSKVRVYELAKEFGVESKVILAKLADLGEFVRSASSTVEPPVVRKLRDAMPAPAAGGAAAAEAPAKKTTRKAPAKKAAVAAPDAESAVAEDAPAAASAPAMKAPAAPAAQTTLNPQAAWPFPTASKP